MLYLPSVVICTFISCKLYISFHYLYFLQFTETLLCCLCLAVCLFLSRFYWNCDIESNVCVHILGPTSQGLAGDGNTMCKTVVGQGCLCFLLQVPDAGGICGEWRRH